MSFNTFSVTLLDGLSFKAENNSYIDSQESLCTSTLPAAPGAAIRGLNHYYVSKRRHDERFALSPGPIGRHSVHIRPSFPSTSEPALGLSTLMATKMVVAIGMVVFLYCVSSIWRNLPAHHQKVHAM